MIELSMYDDNYYPVFVWEEDKYEIGQQVYAQMMGWA